MFISLRACAWRVMAAWAVSGAVPVLADGMIPETSVVIVEEAEGEASVTVTNSDRFPALLHVTLHNIAEDPAALLFVSPPVSRVEPGQTQLVRFILRNQQPLGTQRLKRVVFEGLPQSRAAPVPGEAKVAVTVRQNLPVILHPKGLARNREPWQGLRWSLVPGHLRVHNPSAYVVRLSQEVRLLPGNQALQLPRSYVLPGDQLDLPLPPGAGTASAVRLFPATVYGFAVAAYEAALGARQP